MTQEGRSASSRPCPCPRLPIPPPPVRITCSTSTRATHAATTNCAPASRRTARSALLAPCLNQTESRRPRSRQERENWRRPHPSFSRRPGLETAVPRRSSSTPGIALRRQKTQAQGTLQEVIHFLFVFSQIYSYSGQVVAI